MKGWSYVRTGLGIGLAGVMLGCATKQPECGCEFAHKEGTVIHDTGTVLRIDGKQRGILIMSPEQAANVQFIAPFEASSDHQMQIKEVVQVETEGTSLRGKCLAFVAIPDIAHADAAANLLKSCVLMKSKIKAVMDPIVDAAFKAHRTATAKRNELIKPVEEGEAHLKRLLGDFQLREEERVRREREEAEAAARAELEAQKKAIEEQAIRAAAALEEAGLKDESEKTLVRAQQEILDKQSVEVTAPASSAYKPAGMASRDVWKWKVVDVSKVPSKYLMVNEKLINAEVKVQKDKTDIPGIEVYREKTAFVR